MYDLVFFKTAHMECAGPRDPLRRLTLQNLNVEQIQVSTITEENFPDLGRRWPSL